MAKPIVVGAASASVTLGLAVILILLSQRYSTDTLRKEAPSPDRVELANKTIKQKQAAVFLPPPPESRARPNRSENFSQPAKQRKAPPQKSKGLQPEASKPDPKPSKPTEAPLPPSPPAESVKASARTMSASVSATKKAVTISSITPEAVAEGRVLLRMLEAGKGPTIEIAWPATQAQRNRLYAVLERCYGLRTALMSGDGRIYLDDGPSGVPTHINRDSTSGFVRRPTGEMPAAEKRRVARMQRRHQQEGLTPVRLFPRQVDAVLLAGISKIIGKEYRTLGLVRGRYLSYGDSVLINNITADTKRQSGQIKLPQIGFRSCR